MTNRWGKEWVTADRSDAKFCSLVGSNFKMLDELQRLRTEKSDELMRGLGSANDDLADPENAGDAPMPKRAKKDLADEIPGHAAEKGGGGRTRMRRMGRVRVRGEMIRRNGGGG